MIYTKLYYIFFNLNYSHSQTQCRSMMTKHAWSCKTPFFTSYTYSLLIELKI